MSPSGDSSPDLQADVSMVQPGSQVPAAIMYRQLNMYRMPTLEGRAIAMFDDYCVANDSGRCVFVCVG